MDEATLNHAIETLNYIKSNPNYNVLSVGVNVDTDMGISGQGKKIKRVTIDLECVSDYTLKA